MVWVGPLMGLVSLIPELLNSYTAVSFDKAVLGTMVFSTLALAQMGNALAIRSDRLTLFQLGIFTNSAMIGVVVLTFALQMAVIYVPFLQNIFGTTALNFSQLFLSLGLSTIVFIVVELVKWIRQRKHRKVK